VSYVLSSSLTMGLAPLVGVAAVRSDGLVASPAFLVIAGCVLTAAGTLMGVRVRQAARY